MFTHPSIVPPKPCSITNYVPPSCTQVPHICQILPVAKSSIQSALNLRPRGCLWYPMAIALCNAVVQFFLTPLLLWRNFLSSSLSIALYVVAFVYYHYLNFLGYNSLPFLEHTQVRFLDVHAITFMTPQNAKNTSPLSCTNSIYGCCSCYQISRGTLACRFYG